MTCEERILSNEYGDFIGDYILTEELDNSGITDYCFLELTENLGVFYISRNRVATDANLAYTKNYIPKCYGLGQEEALTSLTKNSYTFSPLSLINTGILPLQGEPLNLTGEGVVIGFVDTGIRYEEEVFRKPDGSTRILAIWDQTLQVGTTPAGFKYGSEYTTEQINRALQSPNPQEIVPSTDLSGHGTAMASVGAGSRLEGGLSFIGAAPDADIVVVKLKEAKQYLRDYYVIPDGVPCYEETDIALAIKYLDSFAISFRRPLVICIGIETNMGDHIGYSPLSEYINRIVNRKSRAVVIAGGTEGNASHHYEGIFKSDVGEKQQDVEIRVGEREKGFFLEFWGQKPYVFALGIRSPGGEEIPFVFSRSGSGQEYSFIFEKTRIIIDYFLIEQGSGDELITLRFQNPTAGIWTIRVFGIGSIKNAAYHLWLPIQSFLTSETYFLQPTPYITLTEPSYARDAITVSTYNDENNGFYINSGRGFARNEKIKPDISAPGVRVSTIYGKQTGSSYAAALTAGGVAQLMEWAVVEGNNTIVNSTEIKGYLIRGATREGNLTYPNKEWGYGRLNMSGVFEWLARGVF